MQLTPLIYREAIVYNVYLMPLSEANQEYSLTGLSFREKEIIQLVRCGLTNHEIAANLFISISTVRTHLAHIFDKLKVNNRTSLCYKFKDTEL